MKTRPISMSFTFCLLIVNLIVKLTTNKMLLNKPLDDTTTTIRERRLKSLLQLFTTFELKYEQFHTICTKNNTTIHISKKFPDIKVLSLDPEHTQLVQNLVNSDNYGVEFIFKPKNIKNIYTITFPDNKNLYFNWTKFNTTPAKFVGEYQHLGSGTWIICDVMGRAEKYFILVRNKEVDANHTPIVGQMTQADANNATKDNFEYLAPDCNTFNPETNALKELVEELGCLIDTPETLGKPIAEFIFNENNKTFCYVHRLFFTIDGIWNFSKRCENFQNSEVGSLILVSSTFIGNITEERFITNTITKFSKQSNDSWLFGYEGEAISKHWFLALQYYNSTEDFQRERFLTWAKNTDYCKIILH